MCWKPLRLREMAAPRAPRSLRAILLTLLLPVLGGATALELWMTDRDARDAANSAYDRSLLGAARSIAANISTASGGLSVELPYRMFEFFELTANGQVYFRVASADGLVELGSADLPAAPGVRGELRTDVPVFYDATYFGEAVRLVALRIPVEGAGETLLIQVAENVRSRQEFTQRFLSLALWRDLLVFAIMLLGVALSVGLALKPLARLAAGVRSRRSDDLAPIDGHGLPAEVQPLVAAVNQQMDRSNQLARQQRGFVDDASHQLRTHLTTLQMQVDYAIGETDLPRAQLAMRAIRDEIGRSTHTTNQLLALARSDSAALQLRGFELGPLARQATLASLPAARHKHIDLGVVAPDAPIHALGDADLLQEALRNLVANAVAYCPPGSVVSVLCAADSLGWSLGVTDNGAGLSETERESLGRRFMKKTGAASQGSGLGLAIARAIAERHGGALRLDLPDAGTGLHASIWWPREGHEEESMT